MEEPKKILCVDYFTENDVKGGVQTLMTEFDSWNEVESKNINADYAAHITSNTLQGDYHTCRSRALSDYVNAYTISNDVDLVVQNSIVAKLHKYNARTVSVINDNNISGVNTCVFHGKMKGVQQDALGNKLLMCQIASCNSSDVVVSVSEPVRRNYLETLGIDSVVINPGIDASNILNKDPILTEVVRRELGLPKKEKTGIIVTSFYPVKGWDVQAEIIKRHPEINWIIVNSHNMDVFKTKRPNVFYLGCLNRKDLQRAYIAADFLINTSRYETFGIAALEAMAADVPLIMSNTGLCWDKKGVTDFGIVVDDYSVSAFSSAINEFYESSYIFEPRKHVEANYGIERWRKGWRDILYHL
ncbi:MAG: glycosyltransferase family 4 protein [Candidatus Aenigmarchaeota archaeon]|nr:glycosyltransferase family 4 protein [Candidatus Aenigmarchaeota archaeon]